MDSHALEMGVGECVQHASMVPGLGPVNTRVNEMLPGLEGQESVRNCHAHLTYGKTEVQISEAIYDGTSVWVGASIPPVTFAFLS